MKIVNYFFVFAVIAILSVQSFGQELDKTYGKPIVVLIGTSPRALVIGSDTPMFVMYENGQIIYKRIINNSLKIYEVKLNKDDLAKTCSELSISNEFYQLKTSISASFATDQPQTVIYLNITKQKSVSVYGRLTSGSEAREKTPTEFLTLYDKIKNFRNKTAKEWLPQKIEVMFWDYSYAPKSKSWLKNFPDLKSPSTIKHGNMYSVFIDQSQFEEFKKFYKSIGEKEAVQINEKKMTLSYRFPFPNL